MLKKNVEKAKLDECRGYRLPDPEEKERVASFMEKELRRDRKRCLVFAVIFSILAVIFVCGMFQAQGTGEKTAYALLAVSCVIGTFFALDSREKAKLEMFVYKTGAYQVLDGKAEKISPNMDLPGVVNVNFRSDTDGQTCGIFRVDSEGLTEETPLILIVISSVISPDRKDKYRVFSPYMLGKGRTDV